MYQEYVESETERDPSGCPIIKKVLQFLLVVKVNNYDLSNYLRTIASLTMSNKKYADPEFPAAK